MKKVDNQEGLKESYVPTRAYVRLNKVRAASIATAITGVVGVIILCLFATVHTGKTGQLINVVEQDDQLFSESVTLKPVNGSAARKDEKGVSYLSVDGLQDMYLTSVKDVLADIKTWELDEQGSPIEPIHEGHDDQNRKTYFAFSYLLINSSNTAIPYIFSIDLANYKAPTNEGAVNPLSYARILLYENDLTSNTHNHSYYAERYKQDTKGAKEGENIHYAEDSDERADCEFLSVYYDDGLATDGSGRKYRYVAPGYDDNGTVLCEKFVDETTLVKINHESNESALQPNSTRRYTVVVYLEGGDKDSFSQAPQDAGFSLSMHFAKAKIGE